MTDLTTDPRYPQWTECRICGMGKNSAVHIDRRDCRHCAAPTDHHDFQPRTQCSECGQELKR